MITLRKMASLCMICLSLSSFSAEFAIINETITMTSSNSGFYFYYNTDKGPVNWVSPDNYKAGQVYFRFEILNQPTNEKCYLSFNIWGDWDSEAKTYTESSAPISAVLNGPGSVSIFNSSPSTWYANAAHGGVNFNNRNTFWRWGIVHWFSKSPNYLLAPRGYSATPESWEAWARRDLWLPLQIKVTIVAVSQGSTFSGWNNYISGTTQTKHPTPSYGINYSTEKTNKTIPSTDEYSYNADMSGAVSGNGQALTLVPGQDVYFRTKASGNLLASSIQHLDVLSRPAAPSYTIDFNNENTVQNVNTNIEYATSSNYSNSKNGTGARVSLTPGQDLYFRVKSGGSSFASGSFSLDVPGRPAAPAISIDYINEVTSAVASSMQYSLNSSMSPATTGTNATVKLTPGTDLYIHKKATATQFSSNVQTLDVPARPAAPAITIDYINEVTSAVASSMQYSLNSSMSPATTGTNATVKLTPGTDLYIHKKATATQFSSNVQTLDVPARPAAPSFGIDFQNEKTSTIVSNTYEYSFNTDMSAAVTGNEMAIPIAPGKTIYFRQKASASQFVSDIQDMIVPSRPDAPVFSIDFVNEMTSEIVPSDHEYSVLPDMNGSKSGEGTEVQLIPGNDYYLRVKNTASSFSSEIFYLVVPVRPLINSTVGDTLIESSFTAIIDFHGEANGFEAIDIEVTNAEVELMELQTIKIEPVAFGEVTLKIRANAILTGNFTSEEMITYYKEIVSSNPDAVESQVSLLLYPNPFANWLEVKVGKSFALPVEIILINGLGTITHHIKMQSEQNTLDMSDALPGFYIVKAIDSKGNVFFGKVTKQ